MALILKPPSPVSSRGKSPRVFLAGSIEMGQADNWQMQFEAALGDLDVTIFNPRRDDWDSSWRQSIDEPQFRTQVEWELQAQEAADVIAMNFVSNTQSPITLLELGLFARSKKLIVHCPAGFWRKGNVDVVCRYYGVKQVKNFTALVNASKMQLQTLRA